MNSVPPSSTQNGLFSPQIDNLVLKSAPQEDVEDEVRLPPITSPKVM